MTKMTLFLSVQCSRCTMQDELESVYDPADAEQPLGQRLAAMLEGEGWIWDQGAERLVCCDCIGRPDFTVLDGGEDLPG